jgi:hypothetical protein
LANRAPKTFRDELRIMAEEKDSVSEADRATLCELANDPCIEQVWTKIVKSCGEEVNVRLRFFVREIISNRSLATRAEIWPDYLANAERAEHLAKFFRGEAGLFPPLPGREYLELADTLQKVSGALRQQATKSLVKISRKKVGDLREYHLFMQLMSLTMRELFQCFFDAEVAILTNIIFPHANATIDSVRSLRRASTKAGRLGKKLAA